MRALWDLFRRNRDFRRLLGAGLISISGDWMLRIGVAYFVYDLTGSTLASAGTLLSTFIPSILFSSLAGVFVDRWNRKTTMVTANLLMAVVLIPLVWVTNPATCGSSMSCRPSRASSSCSSSLLSRRWFHDSWPTRISQPPMP